jgi:superfamily II DNA or RNA helicase
MKANKMRVLIGGNAISEGMDIPNIDNIIFSSLVVTSTRTYVQRLGRVLRPVPDKHVYVAIVYARNTMEESNAVKVYDILGEEYVK